MARKVSTREDLTAGSDEHLSPRRTERHPESAVADLRRAAEWDLLGTGPEVPGTRKLFPAEEWSESSEHLEKTFCRTWGTILNGGNTYRRPLPLSQGTYMASVNSALGSGYGDANLMMPLLVNVANRSTCGSPHLADTGRRRSMAIVHSVFSVWPTLDSESAWTLSTPGRWTETSFIALRSHHFSRRIVSLMRAKDWVPPSFLMYATVTALSHIKRTTQDLWWERKALTRWWRPASPERWCAMIFEMQTTVPVSSVTLTGLDASVKRLTSVSLVARGRPCRTAADDHHATSDSTHWGTVILLDQFPVLWHQAVAAHHWTWTEAKSSPRYQCCHEHHHAQQPVKVAGCDDGVGHPVLMNRLDSWDASSARRHCELSSVELHPYELEVLAWFKVGLLVVDDPA